MRSIKDHIILTGDLGIIDSADAGDVVAAVTYMQTVQDQWLVADPNHQKRIVVFAHGGLTDKVSAQAYVTQSADFWLDNKVYPFYFVWQSGAFESFVDLIENEAKQRTNFSLAIPQAVPSPGHVLVNMITEEIVRDFAPVKDLWAVMKEDASGLSQPSSSGAQKGGLVLGAALANYIQNAHGTELHLIGHSAGSIVHAAFIDYLIQQNVQVKSLSYLAPAIRMDDFMTDTFPHLGHSVQALLMYCLDQDLERNDVCANNGITAYYGSLLWLVSRGFEYDGSQQQTPILGMQYFLEQPGTTTLTPEAALQNAGASIYYAPSPQTNATSHGGFAQEPVTMDSVIKSIIGQPPVKSFSTY